MRPDWLDDNYSPEAAFQSSAVGMMHRLWFEDPWTTVKRQYRLSNENDLVSWEWYRENYVPEIQITPTFSKDTTAWNLNLKTILFTPVKKLKLYQEYEEQPSDALIFPIVGKAGVFRPANSSDDCAGVWFDFSDTTSFVIESLDEWALRIKQREE